MIVVEVLHVEVVVPKFLIVFVIIVGIVVVVIVFVIAAVTWFLLTALPLFVALKAKPGLALSRSQPKWKGGASL